MDDRLERELMDALSVLHDRVNQIADLEARSAWVKGWAAQGGLADEKLRLIRRTDEILDQLMGVSRDLNRTQR